MCLSDVSFWLRSGDVKESRAKMISPILALNHQAILDRYLLFCSKEQVVVLLTNRKL